MFVKSQNLRSVQYADHYFSTRLAAPGDFISVKQVHGNGICVVDDGYSKEDLKNLEADALITDLRGALIGVKTADCCPILLASMKKPVVGAVHSGWKGAKNQIIVKVIEMIKEKFKIKPEELKVTVGPAIGSCCYDIDAGRKDQFIKDFSFAKRYLKNCHDKTFFDLKGFNSELIVQAGVKRENVEVLDFCTSCNSELFYSFRREGERAGRQYSCISIKE